MHHQGVRMNGQSGAQRPLQPASLHVHVVTVIMKGWSTRRTTWQAHLSRGKHGRPAYRLPHPLPPPHSFAVSRIRVDDAAQALILPVLPMPTQPGPVSPFW